MPVTDSGTRPWFFQELEIQGRAGRRRGPRATREWPEEAIEERDRPIDLREGAIELRDKTIDLREGAIELHDKTIDLREGAIELHDKTIDLGKDTIE